MKISTPWSDSRCSWKVALAGEGLLALLWATSPFSPWVPVSMPQCRHPLVAQRQSPRSQQGKITEEEKSAGCWLLGQAVKCSCLVWLELQVILNSFKFNSVLRPAGLCISSWLVGVFGHTQLDMIPPWLLDAAHCTRAGRGSLLWQTSLLWDMTKAGLLSGLGGLSPSWTRLIKAETGTGSPRVSPVKFRVIFSECSSVIY